MALLGKTAPKDASFLKDLPHRIDVARVLAGSIPCPLHYLKPGFYTILIAVRPKYLEVVPETAGFFGVLRHEQETGQKGKGGTQG